MFLGKYNKIVSLATNILLAMLWAMFAYRNFSSYMVSGNLSTLIITISETIMVFIFIFRKNPRATSVRVSDWVIAFIASTLPTLFRPADNLVIWREGYLAIIGGFFLVASYLSLNRSFGIVPALRDVQSRGTYAFVRHPIYASYSLIAIGYYLNNASFINLGILISCIVIMLIRISREEEFLMRDPAYKTYRELVPWKLIPFIY